MLTPVTALPEIAAVPDGAVNGSNRTRANVEAPVMEPHSKSARRRANLSSLSPTCLKQAERICAGLHMAGVPEA